MSLDEAKAFIRRYFRTFPAVDRWIQQTKHFAKTKGYVETLMGRRRYLPRLLPGSDASAERKARAEREAINTVVQGSAAEVMKVTMIQLQRRLQIAGLATKMVLQVHDELLFDVPASELAQAIALIRDVMCNAYPLRAKLGIDLAVGSNWDNGESIKDAAA
jgi:DNA polymerase-1